MGSPGTAGLYLPLCCCASASLSFTSYPMSCQRSQRLIFVVPRVFFYSCVELEPFR